MLGGLLLRGCFVRVWGNRRRFWRVEVGGWFFMVFVDFLIDGFDVFKESLIVVLFRIF
jgi:hypothetical protein